MSTRLPTDEKARGEERAQIEALQATQRKEREAHGDRVKRDVSTPFAEYEEYEAEAGAIRTAQQEAREAQAEWDGAEVDEDRLEDLRRRVERAKRLLGPANKAGRELTARQAREHPAWPRGKLADAAREVEALVELMERSFAAVYAAQGRLSYMHAHGLTAQAPEAMRRVASSIPLARDIAGLLSLPSTRRAEVVETPGLALRLPEGTRAQDLREVFIAPPVAHQRAAREKARAAV